MAPFRSLTRRVRGERGLLERARPQCAGHNQDFRRFSSRPTTCHECMSDYNRKPVPERACGFKSRRVGPLGSLRWLIRGEIGSLSGAERLLSCSFRRDITG